MTIDGTPPREQPEMPHRHGHIKEHGPETGFKVLWWQIDEHAQESEPGIYIKMITPSKPGKTGKIKENKFFRFDQEEEAKKAFQEMATQVDSWNEISK